MYKESLAGWSAGLDWIGGVLFTGFFVEKMKPTSKPQFIIGEFGEGSGSASAFHTDLCS